MHMPKQHNYDNMVCIIIGQIMVFYTAHHSQCVHTRGLALRGVLRCARARLHRIRNGPEQPKKRHKQTRNVCILFYRIFSGDMSRASQQLLSRRRLVADSLHFVYGPQFGHLPRPSIVGRAPFAGFALCCPCVFARKKNNNTKTQQNNSTHGPVLVITFLSF